VIPEYVAYLAAQRNEEAAARNATPNAPVQPEVRAEAPGARLVGIRARLCADLRRLADSLEPTPRRYPATAAHRR